MVRWIRRADSGSDPGRTIRRFRCPVGDGTSKGSPKSVQSEPSHNGKEAILEKDHVVEPESDINPCETGSTVSRVLVRIGRI